MMVGICYLLKILFNKVNNMGTVCTSLPPDKAIIECPHRKTLNLKGKRNVPGQ